MIRLIKIEYLKIKGRKSFWIMTLLYILLLTLFTYSIGSYKLNLNNGLGQEFDLSQFSFFNFPKNIFQIFLFFQFYEKYVSKFSNARSGPAYSTFLENKLIPLVEMIRLIFRYIHYQSKDLNERTSSTPGFP